jgi:hypothetical protein
MNGTETAILRRGLRVPYEKAVAALTLSIQNVAVEARTRLVEIGRLRSQTNSLSSKTYDLTIMYDVI